jgi:hypothetical protein
MTFPGVNRLLGLDGIPKDGCLEAPVRHSDTNTRRQRRVSRDGAELATRRSGGGGRKRAQRFAIQTALYYRKVGEEEWRQATMVNISESGVLFETAHAGWPKTAVEMRFSLGLGSEGASAAQAVCQGLIARAITEPGSARVKALAAKITKFHFVRPVATAEA